MANAGSLQIYAKSPEAGNYQRLTIFATEGLQQTRNTNEYMETDEDYLTSIFTKTTELSRNASTGFSVKNDDKNIAIVDMLADIYAGSGIIDIQYAPDGNEVGKKYYSGQFRMTAFNDTGGIGSDQDVTMSLQNHTKVTRETY